MAVRRVPGDHPDLPSAFNASAPGDRIEVTGRVSAFPTTVTVDDLTIDYALPEGSLLVTLALGPGVRSLAVLGPLNSQLTGNDLDNRIVGGQGSSRSLDGLGGDDLLVGGPGPDRMVGGPGNDTYEVDSNLDVVFRGPTSAPTGPPPVGDRVVERPDEGWDAVWASVDFTLPAHVEGLVLTGAARRGFGNEAPNQIFGNGEANFLAGFGGDDELRGGAGGDTYLVDGRGDRVIEEPSVFGVVDEVLATVDYELPAEVETLTLLAGTGAAWGVGNGASNRIAGNERDNRLVGWGGADTLTGGGGDDLFFIQATPRFRVATTEITDFWPGAGSDDRLAFSRDLFPSREEAFAAARQVGDGVLFVLAERGSVTLLNTRLADLTLDDIVIA